MDETINYRQLMTEVIAKQSLILGPQMAIAQAHKIEELVIDDEGIVLNIDGDETEVLQKLINQYVALSGQIVQATLSSIFKKYPAVSSPESKDATDVTV